MAETQDTTSLKGRIEAALFITREALSFKDIADIVEASIDDVQAALGELIQDYAFRADSSLEIDDTDGYILQVRDDYSDIVNKMMPMDLSAATLRTLSAIAIKSPILQSELIELRGSSAYDHIGELIKRKLVNKRRSGRSYLLSTTRTFQEYFKLADDKQALEHLLTSHQTL
jgi:segregation and condensation protein B